MRLIGRRCTRSNALSRWVIIGRGLESNSRRACSLWSARECRAVEALKVSGGDCGGEPPVPIPNTEVKLASADGTWGAGPWESRSPPDFSRRGPLRHRGGPLLHGGYHARHA